MVLTDEIRSTMQRMELGELQLRGSTSSAVEVGRGLESTGETRMYSREEDHPKVIVIHYVTTFSLQSRYFSWFTNQAVIRVHDVNLSLSMSTVIGLGDLAEDEIITKPLPLDVSFLIISKNIS